MTTIKHSGDLGGLVPLPGWYIIDVDGDGDILGPFEEREGAERYVFDMTGEPVETTTFWTVNENGEAVKA